MLKRVWECCRLVWVGEMLSSPKGSCFVFSPVELNFFLNLYDFFLFKVNMHVI